MKRTLCALLLFVGLLLVENDFAVALAQPRPPSVSSKARKDKTTAGLAGMPTEVLPRNRRLAASSQNFLNNAGLIWPGSFITVPQGYPSRAPTPAEWGYGPGTKQLKAGGSIPFPGWSNITAKSYATPASIWGQYWNTWKKLNGGKLELEGALQPKDFELVWILPPNRGGGNEWSNIVPVRKNDHGASPPVNEPYQPYPDESSAAHFDRWWRQVVHTNDMNCVSRYPYFVSIRGNSPVEIEQIVIYVNLANAWLKKNSPKVIIATKRGESGSIGAQASLAAERERRRAENSKAAKDKDLYKDLVVGHVPDVGISGMPDVNNPPPDCHCTRGWWLPMTVSANSHVGGGLSSKKGETVDRIAIRQLIDGED